MTKQLNNGTRGFVWRGIYLNPKKQKNNDPTIYKERLKGINYTHIYTDTSYEKYKDRYGLVYRQNRKNPLKEGQITLDMFIK